MCVIIQLPPSFKINEKKLENAVLNNPDGWGIVIHDRGKLDVRKDYNDKGNDPDFIQKLVADAIDTTRYLHVRKNTVGVNSKDNAHPFTVFNGSRRVEFMHNGTLHKWKPGATNNTTSDTRNFAENFLSPLLYRFQGKEGLGDYSDPFFKVLLGDTFGDWNRGLLISEDLPILELGKWEVIKNDLNSEEAFRASNKDYFDYQISTRMSNTYRGTAVNQQTTFQQNPQYGNQGYSTPASVQKATETVEKATAATSEARQVTPLKEANLAKKADNRLRVEDVEGLMSFLGSDSMAFMEEVDNEDITYFQWLSETEFKNWFDKHPGEGFLFLKFLIGRFSELYEEYNEVDEARVEATEKHARATARIAELVQTIAEYEKGESSTKKERKAA